ncbi:hypothetical protein CYLTODRAFT_425432, partial [Cylindrobasidium torrendii FP15055 ss-10]
MTHHDSHASLPHVGRTFTIVVFICTLVAFVVESEMTQYVQTTLGFRKPFFIFFVVHSAFAIIFPLHVLYLKVASTSSTTSLLRSLSLALREQMRVPSNARFPTARFISLIMVLMVACNLPGMLWFAAVTMASVSDVTAIWNTNAFFSYLISVKVFHLRWEARRLFAVVLATVGVLVVVYGGHKSSKSSSSSGPSTNTVPGPTAPLIGDLITLAASIGYALYQVMYKKYAALPSDPERAEYEPLLEEEVFDTADPEVVQADEVRALKDADVTPPLPFGFHPNFLTSTIGVSTALVMWIIFPALHFLDIETFVFPTRLATLGGIAAIALSGVIFNSGFMILLAMWGPVMTSVGGLLTIVLVFIADILWGAGLQAVSIGGVVGSCIILLAFTILASDLVRAST